MQMHRHLASLLILLTTFLGGCEETVSPFLGEDRPFTIYGYLDPTTDTQVIRVVPISENINNVSILEVDAEVRTVHIESNEEIVWQKTPTLFSDSTEGVVFTANFTPLFENAYRLEVTNDIGERVTAETVVPREISAVRIQRGNSLQPGFFLPGDLPNLVQVSMNYSALAMQPAISGLTDIIVPVRVSYRGKEIAVTDGWEVRANLRSDREKVLSAMADFCVTTPFITIRTAEFEFFIGDDAWVPPGNDFNAEELVQPGVFSNIENGYGYFGSGYSFNFAITMNSTILEQIGYVVDRPCQTGPGFDPTIPECQDIFTCTE